MDQPGQSEPLPLCFVHIPSTDEFVSLWVDVIRPAVESAGFREERVNRSALKESIKPPKIAYKLCFPKL